MTLADDGFIEIGASRLEYKMIGPRPGEAATFVLLHEGLGSVGIWGDFPARLAAATGLGVFAYSRAGYGRSSPSAMPRRVTFTRIVLPIALPGMVAAFILAMVLCWNEYFFASLLTGFNAQTLPVMVASQTGSQGINWWSMAALSTSAILPLIIIGIVLERYIIKGLTAGAGK